MSIGFMPMSDDESDYTKRRIEESYDVGYVSGISEVVSVTAKELQELREYKSKVEKFISKYDGSIVLLPGEMVLTWNQCIQKLKEELGYENQL